MDLGVVTEILADVLKFYSYKNLDEIAEFNNIITTTEFLAKDIFNKILLNNDIIIFIIFYLKILNIKFIIFYLKILIEIY